MDESNSSVALTDYALARHKFLAAVQETPSKWLENKALVDALKSQGALAAFTLQQHKIYPCALNTLKKSATLCLDGGFSELDELRKSAAERIQHALNAVTEGKPTTKAYYKQRLGEVEMQNSQLRDDLWHVSRAFYKAVTNARSYASESGDAALIARCSEDERELRAMVSLARNKPMRFQEREDNER